MTPECTNGPPLPIDYFFWDLAEDQQEQAIGIVLSGTSTDPCPELVALLNPFREGHSRSAASAAVVVSLILRDSALPN